MNRSPTPKSPPRQRRERPSAGDTQPAPFVVVLGMHRSGTSLCAQVLRALGVAMGDEAEARESNPNGQWERLEIVERHDRILELFNRSYYSPLHDLPLPTGWWADPRVGEIEREIIALIRQERVDGVPFGFKDPRTARLLPMWRHIFEELGLNPKIVLCLRAPAQVARSLNRRDGVPEDLGEYRWLVYMAEILRNLHSFESCTIAYEAWFDGSADNLATLAGFLGVALDAELRATAAQIVEPALRHDERDLPVARLRLVRSFYELVCRFDADPSARADAGRMLDHLAAYQQIHEPVEAEYARVSHLATAFLRGIGGDPGRRVLSWRDPAVETEWRRLAGGAMPADAAGLRVHTLLRQRAELDAELARTQQEAALRGRGVEAAHRTIAELRHRLGEAATPTAGYGGARPHAPAAVGYLTAEEALHALAQTPVPPDGNLDPALAEQLIAAVLNEGRLDLTERLVDVRLGDAEYCYLLALKLLEAGLSEAALKAALNSTNAAVNSTPRGLREARYYERLAGVLVSVGRQQPAIEAMKVACELAPEWQHARDSLRKMLDKAGDTLPNL